MSSEAAVSTSSNSGSGLALSGVSAGVTVFWSGASIAAQQSHTSDEYVPGFRLQSTEARGMGSGSISPPSPLKSAVSPHALSGKE